MHQETHETGRDDRVANPYVPRSPLGLQPTELGEVGFGVEHAGMRVRKRGRVGHG